MLTVGALGQGAAMLTAAVAWRRSLWAAVALAGLLLLTLYLVENWT